MRKWGFNTFYFSIEKKKPTILFFGCEYEALNSLTHIVEENRKSFDFYLYERKINNYKGFCLCLYISSLPHLSLNKDKKIIIFLLI
jgi:hypothetical protein